MNLNYNTNHKLLFLTAFGIFFFLSIIIAIYPASNSTAYAKPLLASRAMTPEELRGFHVYIAEGCANCHTQQVRPLLMDEPYGRPSVPGDFVRQTTQSWWMQTPNILGTERIGPDLADVAKRRNNDVWNYIHLYNPRSVVPESVMPSFGWLFREKDEISPDDMVIPVPQSSSAGYTHVVLTPKVRDLMAYIMYLNQPALSDAEKITEDAKFKRSSITDRFVDGINVYQQHCASCHGQKGEGIKGVIPPLNDTVTTITPEMKIAKVMNGVTNAYDRSKNMPAFREILSDEEISAVLNYVSKSWHKPGDRIVSPEEIHSLRLKTIN